MKNKISGVWADFKKFISRGNVLDMAVGVIIGTAFGAIVTAFTNILLAVCTWAVPGGLAGLVTVLPAVTSTQKAYQSIAIVGSDGVTYGLQASYSASDWISFLGNFDATQASTISGLYVNKGGSYYYSGLAIMDWGTLINAIISFFIIAVVLFTIVRTVSVLRAKRLALESKVKDKIKTEHNANTVAPADDKTPAAK